MAPRTQKRSRSGADVACPHCAKKLSGAKGLRMHLADLHPEPTAANPLLEQQLLNSVATAIGQVQP